MIEYSICFFFKGKNESMIIIKYSIIIFCGNFNFLKGFRLGILGENCFKSGLVIR